MGLEYAYLDKLDKPLVKSAKACTSKITELVVEYTEYRVLNDVSINNDIFDFQNKLSDIVTTYKLKISKQLTDIYTGAVGLSINSDLKIHRQAGKKINKNDLPKKSKKIYRKNKKDMINDNVSSFKVIEDEVNSSIDDIIKKAIDDFEKGRPIENILSEVEAYSNKTGVVVVSDKGYRFQLSTVVSRNVYRSTSQACADITLDLCDELETELVEVTSHFGARPTHADWQGQIYALGKSTPAYDNFEDVCEYGAIEGICGVNCKHSFYPYYENLSEKTFTKYDIEKNNKAYYERQEELRELRKNQNG